MAAVLQQSRPLSARPAAPRGARLLTLLQTTDHKQIGLMYVATSMAFFLAGGAMAMLMRGELARPGLQFLSREQYNLWIMGLTLAGLGTILTAVNMVTTVVCLRAHRGADGPGCRSAHWRPCLRSGQWRGHPLATLVLVLRSPGSLYRGAAILRDHLRGHPGFSRKPLFGYKGLVFATVAITVLSVVVWAHHMWATGAVLLPFFIFNTLLIAIPTGVKFFNWIGTMWHGQLTFETPMLFAIGFLVTFLLGGLTGALAALPPITWHFHDTYFVVAHFHYVLYGTIAFATFAGIYFWFPKFTGRMFSEPLGRLHFWATFIGFHLTFLVHHWLGNEGMPRRYADYLPSDGFTTLNMVSTTGAFLLGLSTLPSSGTFSAATATERSLTSTTRGGYGNSLEWATSSPPPRHNFTALPRIRSERPAFELHHPHMRQRMRAEAHAHSKHPPATPSPLGTRIAGPMKIISTRPSPGP